MATPHNAFYVGPSSHNSSRKPSTTSSSSTSSTKKAKLMSLLAPRLPVHEPLTPTNAGKENRKVTVSETEYAPARIYDSVLRRPLFSKAKPGNEQTLTQRAERQKKAMASVDRVYTVHMVGDQQDKSWQRAAYGA